MRQALYLAGVIVLFALAVFIFAFPSTIAGLVEEKKISFKQDISTQESTRYKPLGIVKLDGNSGESLVFKIQVSNVSASNLDQLYLVSDGLSSSSSKIESSQIVTSPAVGNYAFDLPAKASKSFDFTIKLKDEPKGDYKGFIEAVDSKRNKLGEFEVDLNIT